MNKPTDSKAVAVEVVRFGTDEVVHRVWARSALEADKVSAGMDINLDHDRFYTRIVKEVAK